MNPETTPIRVMLVDNHLVIRDGLALMLQYQPDLEAVAQASNGKEAIELYRKHRPDVTLMDLRMPVMDGIEATRALCAEFPDARIILLSTYDGDEGIYQALRAGAKAFLLKDSTCAELLEAIRIVHSGKSHITATTGAKLLARMTMPELTGREREVLQCMARGQSNHEIANTLFVTEGTVKFHVNHILSKLDVSDRTQAVLVALKRGIASLA